MLTFVLVKFYNSPQERAAFWHSLTRYFSTGFTLSSFGVSMLLPIMFAYVVQILLAAYMSYESRCE